MKAGSIALSVLLALYVAAYLWVRKDGLTLTSSALPKGARILVVPRSLQGANLSKTFQIVFKPMAWLETRLTGVEIYFPQDLQLVP